MSVVFETSSARIWFGYDVRCRWSSSDKKFFLRLDGRTGVKTIYFWQCGYIKRSTRLLSPPKSMLSVNFNSLNVQWMLTECSRKSGLSGTVQWSFSPNECYWNAGTILWPFRFFFYFQKEHNSKMFHQIRCIKFILLWITAHEKKSLKKHSNIYMYILFNKKIERKSFLVLNECSFLCWIT